jgi:hypothetical protein
MDIDNTSDLTPAALDRRRTRRAAFRDRQTEGLTRLMTQRHDLRGAHALADFIDDAVRWTA